MAGKLSALKTNFISSIRITPFHLLFLLIILLGFFARTWEFGSLPPGLNQDEASIGVEAFNLVHYGVDRHGVSYPVHFISWGSGQNALYAYLMIPFIVLNGLTPITVRFPMLVSGILALPLVYFVARRTMGEKYALLSMFFLAICPWHIVLSRWGLESNLLPFVFLLGYTCLLMSEAYNNWFIAANVFFALCLFTYGTAYAAVPVFLACAIPILLRWKKVSARNLVIGLVVFVVLSLPIGLFILVNTLELRGIQLGIFTIPNLLSEPRYVTESNVLSADLFFAMTRNLKTLFYLLGIQTDVFVWNSVDPYGYFYTFTFPLAIIGVVQLIWPRRSSNLPERMLLLSWLAASLTIGLLQPVNINRINLIFIPLILCMAIPLIWLGERQKVVLVFTICALLVGFAAFTRDYHGKDYRQEAGKVFFYGLLPALDFARQTGDPNSPICVTDTVNMPYIFALFSEQMNPADYLKDVIYRFPKGKDLQVQSFGRYTFDMQNCPTDRRTIYVLSRKEGPPDTGIDYKLSKFANYQVYMP